MIRNILSILIALAIIVFAAKWMLSNTATHFSHEHIEHSAGMEEEDFARGPHRGRLLTEDNFAVEVTIFETGVPPEFHIYAYDQGQIIDPAEVNLSIELGRLGGDVDVFKFTPQADYLRGDGVVTEPHSFDVTVEAEYQDNVYRWTYENYEGRTRILEVMAQEAGIKTEIAGPATITEFLTLNGRVQIDPDKQAHVQPRYPGVVQSVRKKLGDVVKKGELLLTIQSNESLQNYDIKAPISGLVTQRNVQAGESTGDETLYVITDLSQVWIELDVFSKDLSLIETGQYVDIATLDDRHFQGNIKNLWPMASPESQSVKVIVPLENKKGELRPGQIVRGKVKIAEHEVLLAVRQSALQRFRDFRVVFARFDDTYEVRMLELGRSNQEWVEVLDGLKHGTEYVTENSYLIKADIEKSGATHDH